MEIPAGVPQGEHGVAVLSFGDTAYAAGAELQLRLPVASGGNLITVHGGRIAEFHQRVLAVHVFQDVGVDERMVQGGIENRLLFLGSAGHADPAEMVLPALLCGCSDGVEIETGLLFFQILPCVIDAYE